MKHILLISFYYPPYNGIEGNRVYNWAKALHKAGYQVTVLTRQWLEGGQNVWADYIAEYTESDQAVTEVVAEGLTIVRLPHVWRGAYRNQSQSAFSSIHYWMDKVKGHFHSETAAHNSFKAAALALIQKSAVDLIIVSSPPLNLIRLGFELQQETGTPYLADFRDSYDNHKLRAAYKAPLKQGVENFFFKKHLQKWLQTASAVISVDKSVAFTIQKAFPQPLLIIRNGFEQDLFEELPLIENRELFKLTITGNLYAHQNIALVAQGIGDFVREGAPAQFLAQFVGLLGNKPVADILRAYIPDTHLLLTDRKPRKEALLAMRDSQVLLQVGWPGYEGMCPGKIYEYMAAGKNILVAPGDGNLTDQVIRETGTGFSADSAAAVTRYLTDKYQEWLSTGKLAYAGNAEAIQKYSREAQNSVLIQFLGTFWREGEPPTGRQRK